MSFNGAGSFTRLYSWVQQAGLGTKIRSDLMDTDSNDIASGLSNVICKDGQTTITQNIPFNNKKITGLGAGTLAADASQLQQVQSGQINWVVAGGTADALTATYTPSIASLTDGLICFVRAGAANATTTPTFAPNGLTAHTITKNGGQALVAGDIYGAGHEIALRYKLSSTLWELLNPSVIPAVAVTDATISVTDILTNNVSTSKHGFAPKLPNDSTKFLDGTGAYSVPTVPYITRNAQSGGYTIIATDKNSIVDFTGSGSATFAFTAAATLGSGWFCFIRNNGTSQAELTLDPNSTEQIDGLTSFIMYPGEERLVQCTGTAFNSIILKGFLRQYTSSGTFTAPPGYQEFDCEGWGAGGGGGTNATGGGGGGGGYNRLRISTSAMSTSQTITIGAGAAATAGGNSSVGSLLVCYGGGAAGTGANSGGGGGGGLTAAGANAATTTGGNGGAPVGTTLSGAGGAADANGADGIGGGGGGGGHSSGAPSGANGISFGGGGGSGGGANAMAPGASIYGGGGGHGSGTGTGGISVYGGAGGATTVAGSVPGGGGGRNAAGASGQINIRGTV